MAYIPTAWVDHISSGNVYNIYNNDDGTKEILFAGQVIQQGTPMSAENFNHMEEGILTASQIAEEANTTSKSNLNKINNNTAAITNIGNNLKTDETRITGLEQKTTDMYSKSEVIEIIAHKIAEIVAGAPEDFDTLKEMYDWLLNHEDSAAAMNSEISGNASTINALKASVTNLQNADVELSKNIASANQTANVANGKVNNLTARVSELEDDITTQSAVNADHIQRIKDNASGVIVNQTTLGYQKKNLLKNRGTSQIINGVTFTINEDKTVTANGTATDNATLHLSDSVKLNVGTKYILSGCPEGGGLSTYRLYGLSNGYGWYDNGSDEGESKQFTATESESYTYRICVYKGTTVNNLVFKPMICFADITDDTYEPYVDDVDTRITENKSDIKINETTLGYTKKNLMKLAYAPGYTHTNNAKSVTWTFNSDYSISMVVTTALTSGMSLEYSRVTLQPGTYIHSVKGYSTPNITHTQLYSLNNDGSTNFLANLSAIENTITVTEETTYSFRAYRNAAVTVGVTETFFPMIRCADITDDTFEPYIDDVDTRLNAVETTVGEINGELGAMSRNIGAAFDELDAFEIQSQLYSNTSVSASVLTVNIPNLFADYSAVTCNIVTSNGRYTQVLPLKYIKSLGTDTYYQAGEMIYYYVDNSNLKIYTGLGQSNPTMTQVQIIGIY